MTLSKEVRRRAPSSLIVPGFVLAMCMSGPVAGAPGFAPMRPGPGIGQRGVAASHVGPGVRSGGDSRHARHDGGGVGIAVLPVAAPIEPSAGPPALIDEALIGRADERWAFGEASQRAACIRPLIIELRAPPRTPQSGPRVVYGTAPPACPRS